ncbi:MAG: hypothetical protein KDA60_08755 [Planctomycetales bacterium]|nr:hypothetical protein [Planctomycetales bacterium]
MLKQPSPIRYVLVVVMLWAFDSPLAAQDPITTDSSEAETPPVRPVASRAVEIIRESQPDTIDELLSAIDNLIKLGAPDLAHEYLQQVLTKATDEATLAQIANDYGSAFLIRIARDDRLAPAGHELAAKSLAAARHLAQTPSRIDQLIDALRSADVSRRRRALRHLGDAGDAAVWPLAKATADAISPAERSQLLLGLISLGPDAVEPMYALRRAPSPQLRAVAIDVLGHAETQSRALTHLYYPTLMDPAPEVQQSAARIWQVLGIASPTIEQAIPQLRTRIRDLLDHGDLFAFADHQGLSSSWRFDMEMSQLVADRVPRPAAAAIEAARLADDLYRLNPATREDQVLFIEAQVAASKWKHGLDAPLAQAAPDFLQQIAGMGVDVVEQALADAIKHDLTTAAAGLAEILGAYRDPAVLQGWEGRPRPLVQALRHGDRRVAFAAGSAIMEIDPQQAYVGAADMMDLAGFLAGSNGTRRALLIHPRLDQGSNILGLLQQSGVIGDQVVEARRALQQSRQHPDYEFILLSDRVYGPRWYELYQQLRRDPRVGRLPIAILAQSIHLNEIRQLTLSDKRTMVYPEPYSVETVRSLLDELYANLAGHATSADMRLSQASAAIRWMDHIAADESRYRFYELMPWEERLADSLYTPQLARPAMRALARWATPEAQLALVDYASQGDHPEEMRRAAAHAFNYAVHQRGLQLTGRQVARQYDRYNASETQSVATQEILGAILDVIESDPDVGS